MGKVYSASISRFVDVEFDVLRAVLLWKEYGWE